MSQPCPICYCDIVSKTTGVTTLSCSHSFHLGCIVPWILKSETCPCCRSEVTEFEKIPRSHIHSGTRTLSYESEWLDSRPIPILQLPRIFRTRFSIFDPEAPEFIPGQGAFQHFQQSLQQEVIQIQSDQDV